MILEEVVLIFLYLLNYYFRNNENKKLKLNNKQSCQTSTCSICLDDLDNNNNNMITTYECDHQFHRDCLNEWVRKSATCPNCRKQLKTIEIPIDI